MIYYKLKSRFEWDITKNCGLTIDEVDGNFYELETKLFELEERIINCCEKLNRETFYINSLPFSDETNKDTTFTRVEGENETYEICGKVGYNYTKNGNFVKLALAPNIYNLKRKYPDAKYTLVNDSMCDNTISRPKNLWDTYDENENVFLFDLCVKEGDTNFWLEIQWAEGETEDYMYVICNNIELEKRLYHYSRTCHDTEICPPGTSNQATYTLDDKGYNMTVCGKIDYLKTILPSGNEMGNRFGVAIVPLKDETEMYTDLNELEALYPNAEYYVGSNNMGSIYDEIRRNDPSWPLAMYLYPKVTKSGDEIIVELGGYRGCDNSLTINIKWNNEITETYTYTVCDDVELEERVVSSMVAPYTTVTPPGVSPNTTYTFTTPLNSDMEIGGEIEYVTEVGNTGNRFGVVVLPFKPNTDETYGTVNDDLTQFNSDYPNAVYRINDGEWRSINDELAETTPSNPLGLYITPKVYREDGVVYITTDNEQ